jgi:hypothetical protein
MAPVSQMAMHDAMQADMINQGLQGQQMPGAPPGAAPPPGALGMAGALSPVSPPGLPPPANGNNPLGG